MRAMRVPTCKVGLGGSVCSLMTLGVVLCGWKDEVQATKVITKVIISGRCVPTCTPSFMPWPMGHGTCMDHGHGPMMLSPHARHLHSGRPRGHSQFSAMHIA